MAAQDNLTMAKSKYYYDKKINPYTFNKGDYAYLLKQLQKGKLDNQYVGPFVTFVKIDNHNVRLTVGKKRRKIVHEDKLKMANILEDEFDSKITAN